MAVLEGRHFQDFATGDSGVVIRSDVDARNLSGTPQGMRAWGDGLLGKESLILAIWSR